MASFVSIYARALSDVVIDRKLDAARVTSELESLGALLNESGELRTIWDNPSVTADQKLKLLDALVQRLSLSKEIRNFAAVLISNRRIHAFREISAAAIQDINSRLGIADAEIVSARELSADERRKLEEQVAKVTGKRLRVRYAQDHSLLGGVIVKVGSTIYDGSVHGQLQRMKEQLAAR
ncbi:MAG: ATP synthase F1 subunit delta [Acidobacteria bacterium]|nr:ATP synthase F1 subunit delta [Acidobacteriota bacterium]MBV9437269.1 ATP synthase F1 subunit delta [Acidobacteriota bacterium]